LTYGARARPRGAGASRTRVCGGQPGEDELENRLDGCLYYYRSRIVVWFQGRG